MVGSVYTIRKVQHQDLPEIVSLIEQSIIKLCAKDHGNQRQHIDTWLENRSHQVLERDLFDGQSKAFVCLNANTIAGIVDITHSGVLRLCYVHPDFIGKGIGHRLLQIAELLAKQWHTTKISITSTATAYDYYLSHGYVQVAEPAHCFGMPGYPLEKRIPKG